MAWADTWTNTNNSGTLAWYNICCSSDGVKLAAVVGASGQSGKIFVSTNTATSWNSHSTTGGRFDVACADDFSVVIASPLSGYLERSLDDGATWSTINSSRAWRGVCCSSDGSIWYAAVSSGKIWKSTNYGATFSELTSAPTKAWYRVCCSADGSVIFASINQGGAAPYLSTDSGANWNTVGPATLTNCQAISMSLDGVNLYANTSGGFIHVSNDGGANWQTRNISGAGYSSACSADGRFVLIHVGTTVYASTDYGGNFYSAKTSATANGMCLSNDGTIGHLAVFAANIWTSYTNSLTIESVVPDFGPIAGGQSVTINGFGFVSGATVKFDTSDATSVSVVSSEQITCVTPAHVAGPVDVTVTNP